MNIKGAFSIAIFSIIIGGSTSPKTLASQPDLRIHVHSSFETQGKRNKGNGIYNTTADRQKGIVISRRGYRAGDFEIHWENDTANGQGHDFSYFHGSRGKRRTDVRYVQDFESDTRENITAAVLAGTYQTQDQPAPGPTGGIKPGDRYAIVIRKKRGYRHRSITVKLTARSDFSGKKDAVKAQLKLKN